MFTNDNPLNATDPIGTYAWSGGGGGAGGQIVDPVAAAEAVVALLSEQAKAGDFAGVTKLKGNGEILYRANGDVAVALVKTKNGYQFSVLDVPQSSGGSTSQVPIGAKVVIAGGLVSAGGYAVIGVGEGLAAFGIVTTEGLALTGVGIVAAGGAAVVVGLGFLVWSIF